jgi:hypothetical protein
MRIGELLVAAKLVTEADVARAVERQRDEGGRLGPNLVAVDAIEADALAAFIAAIPPEPATLQETGLDTNTLLDLMLKLLFIGPSETVAALAQILCLSPKLVIDLMESGVRAQFVAGLTASDKDVDALVHALTVAHGLPLAAFQPRFLIEQIVAACHFRGVGNALHPDMVELAISNLTVGRSRSDTPTLAKVA